MPSLILVLRFIYNGLFVKESEKKKKGDERKDEVYLFVYYRLYCTVATVLVLSV